MNPIEKLEALLIHDNRPSRELIDYKIDARVNAMIEEYIGAQNNENLESLIDVKKSITINDNELLIGIRKEDFKWLFEEVKNSLQRYGGYVSIDSRSAPLLQAQDYKDLPKNSIVEAGFCLTIRISKEHKNLIIEKRALEAALPKKKATNTANTNIVNKNSRNLKNNKI